MDSKEDYKERQEKMQNRGDRETERQNEKLSLQNIE